MQGIKKFLAIAIAALMLVLPAQAVAQSPTNDAYDNSSVQVVDPGDPVDPGSHSSDPGGLPFTGLDVALLVAMGVGLAGMGFGLRRLTRRPHTAS